MDMECLREGSGRLVVNLVVVQGELGDEWVFEGLQALPRFYKSHFSEEGKLHRYTLGITKYVRVFVHNGSRFDWTRKVHRQRLGSGFRWWSYSADKNLRR